jgi:hypothetical protein
MIITLRPEPLPSTIGGVVGFSVASTAAVGPDGPLMSRARLGRSDLLGIWGLTKSLLVYSHAIDQWMDAEEISAAIVTARQWCSCTTERAYFVLDHRQ